MSSNDVFKAEKVPSARTNVFNLKDNFDVLLSKLLEPINNGLYVTYKYQKFLKVEESNALFEQRIHREIKTIIRTDLLLEDTANVQYQTAKLFKDGAVMVYFFYLSTKPITKRELLEQIQGLNDFGKKQLITGLFGLLLKSEFIEQVKNKFDFSPSFFNSELYISVKFSGKENKDGRAYLEALKPEIFISETNELIFKLVKKVFRTQLIDGIRGVVDDTQILFKNKDRTYKATSEVSATKYSKRKFMSFGTGYPDCINYAQNLIADTLEGLLVRLGISFTAREFVATHVLDSFINNDKHLSSDVIVIDNIEDGFEKTKKDSVLSQVSLEFKNNNSIVTSHTPMLEDLDTQKNYLVLNAIETKGGNSILVVGISTEINIFWDAFRKVPLEKREYLDYYTRLKIERFEKQGSHVIQGLNIFEGEREPLNRKTGDVLAISPYKLNRIKSELWLKERVFRYGEFNDIALPEGEFTLIYARSLFGNNKSFFASIVNVEIQDNSLNIMSTKILNSELRLRLECPYLGKRKVFNDSFYIYDQRNKTLLTSYSSDRIPQIIGNTKVDNISIVESEKLGVNRKSATDISVLPYYLLPKERKQYHHIYLQERGPDLLYFVAPKQRPNQEIAKQNRISNILTFDEQGKLLNALEQTVTKVFLNSFTEDILKLNEVSKSSLLEKIAKLYLEN